jgi:NMD protein affecting ribosome stability and mRNA decay
MAKEPCVVCGDETMIGSPYFSSRRQVAGPGAAAAFLCSDCEARSHPSRRHELSDEERRRLNEHALMFGIAFNATGH